MARKKGTTNQVVAHLFDVDSFMHIDSFKGTSEKDVREQVNEYLRVAGSVDGKYIMLWGMGELITFTAVTEKAKAEHYAEEFFSTFNPDNEEDW